MHNSDLYDDSNEKLWVVIRSLKSGDKKVNYKLQRQDVIKLGRVKIKVMDFKVDSSPDPKDREPNIIEQGPQEIKIYNC